MDDGMIELDTTDGPMAAYEALPDGEVRGAVVVVQEAFGVNDHIKDVTRRFAAAGYRAIAPELFHRVGGGTAPYDDFEKVLPLFAGLDDAAILVDVGAAIDHLNGAGFGDDKIAIVGFCMGGRTTFLVAGRRPLGAAVGFYGGGIVTARFPQFPPLIDEAPAMPTPWLGLFGDRDGSIPVADVERLRDELAAAPATCEVVRYPDAEHGFHCDVRAAYNEAAAKDAWARTLAWLERFVG